MKSKKLFESFRKYCVTHQEERFWQALTNWSKYRFIFGSQSDSFEDFTNLEDVFYIDDEK